MGILRENLRGLGCQVGHHLPDQDADWVAVDRHLRSSCCVTGEYTECFCIAGCYGSGVAPCRNWGHAEPLPQARSDNAASLPCQRGGANLRRFEALLLSGEKFFG